MLRQINDITVYAGQFQEGALLKNIISGPFNILYGANGSGKTTISRHFIEHNHDLYGDKAFVFNEKFITDNVYFRKEENKDGIKAIAMIGHQEIADETTRTNLRKVIEDYDQEITKANEQITTANIEIENLGTKIIDLLNNSTDGYAKRSSLSVGNTKLTALYKVNTVSDLEDLISKIILLQTTTANQVDVRVITNDLIDTLSPMKGKEKLPVSWMKPQHNLNNVIDRADELLKKTIEKPLTPHGEMIIDSLENVAEIQNRLVDAEADVCPLCHQPITADYIIKLKEAIESLLNQEAEDFKNEINSCLDSLSVPYMNLQVVEKVKLKNVTQDKVVSGLKELENRIDVVKQRLNDKLVHLYDVVEPLEEKENILKPIDDLLIAIESDVAEYNKSCIEFKENKESFEKNNLLLAYLENKSDFDQYIGCKNIIKNEVAHIRECKEKQYDAQQELQKLSESGCQDKIQAMNFINECLAMVFFDGMHLQLNVEENQYVIKVRGKDVKPEMLSTGEINVLAMAYFFATLFAGKSNDDKYNDEMLIVVDDPISSFDNYNKMGMVMMMCSQFVNILKGNRNSKILVLTHDLATLNELCDARDRVLTEPFHLYKDENGNNDLFYSNRNLPYYKLEKHEIKEVFNRESTEYSSLLDRICIYALSDNEYEMEEESLVIGNIMRRVTEQYTLFNHGRNIGEVFKKFAWDKKESLDEETQKLFKFFPSKLLMNMTSHEAVDTFNNHMTYENKRMLARAIIFFMLVKNKYHLMAQLDKEINRYNDILAFFDIPDGKGTPNCSKIK